MISAKVAVADGDDGARLDADGVFSDVIAPQVIEGDANGAVALALGPGGERVASNVDSFHAATPSKAPHHRPIGAHRQGGTAVFADVPRDFPDPTHLAGKVLVS
jgi:hypothetical protein